MTLKKFLINIGLLILFVLLIIFVTLWWLGIYTNHGQKLELPNYLEQNIEEAIIDAEDRSFEIIVNDSIHKLGVPGGQILNQNPRGGSQVKENRKIYVSIAKYKADQILSENLPSNIYGRDFDMVSRELANQEIFTKVKGYSYDNAAPNTILEVWYKGQQIIGRYKRKEGVVMEKGDTIEMILTKNTEGDAEVPDLICSTVGSAKFVISASKLNIGQIITESEDIEDLNSAYVTRQEPSAGGTLVMGELVNIYVSKTKPSNCQ